MWLAKCPTEVLAEWVENGRTWYRVTRVNGLIRLETAANGSRKEDRDWVMCVPEGREAFDALLVGIAKIDRDRSRMLQAARWLYAEMQRIVAGAIGTTAPNVRPEVPPEIEKLMQREP